MLLRNVQWLWIYLYASLIMDEPCNADAWECRICVSNPMLESVAKQHL